MPARSLSSGFRTLVLVALVLALTAATGMPGRAVAQDNPDGTYELELRDGSKLTLKNYDFNATGVIGEDVNLSGVTLRVPWSYVAPLQAMALRAALLGENPTVAERMDLINWARGFEELGEGVRQQLQAVLLRDPGHPAANRIARQMGLAMQNGQLTRAPEDGAPSGGTGANPGTPTGNAPTGNRPPANQPDSPQPVRPVGPARISLSVTADIDWSGQYQKYSDRKPSNSAEEQMRRFFERRGFKLVTSNAEFVIEVFIKVKPLAISEFFDLPVAAEFSGTAAGSVTDRRETTPKRKDVPAVESKVQRTDVQAALDGVLADLVERIGADCANGCR